LIVERTTDPNIIRFVLESSGEFVPDGAAERAVMLYICLAIYDDGLVGAVALKPINEDIYEIHVSVIRKGTGRAASKAAINWAFENTPCQKIIAMIPDNRTDVKNLAVKSGLKYEGKIKVNNNKNIIMYGEDKCLG